jgi:hypothetical protein
VETQSDGVHVDLDREELDLCSDKSHVVFFDKRFGILFASDKYRMAYDIFAETDFQPVNRIFSRKIHD